MSDSLLLRARTDDDAETHLTAPSVGVFEPSVREGQVVTAGQVVGTLDVLGVRRDLRAPDALTGQVVDIAGGGRSRVPVQYGQTLLTLSLAVETGETSTGAQTSKQAKAGLAFVAPMSGRFYSRPSPQDPAFVSVGDTIRLGQTVGLLEVMKTFNRLVYQGDGLPDVAVVETIAPADGDDVVRGDVLLALRPVDRES